MLSKRLPTLFAQLHVAYASRSCLWIERDESNDLTVISKITFRHLQITSWNLKLMFINRRQLICQNVSKFTCCSGTFIIPKIKLRGLLNGSKLLFTFTSQIILILSKPQPFFTFVIFSFIVYGIYVSCLMSALSRHVWYTDSKAFKFW